MSLSVLIVHRNDSYLKLCIDSLLRGTDHSLFEIIVFDDASDEVPDLSEYPNVRVISNKVNRGVGYGMDRLVEQAKYETIVLTASDVIVKDSSWFDKAVKYASENPYAMGCSCCIELDPQHLDPNHPSEKSVKRYGATTLIYSQSEDLPADSPVRDGQKYYVGLFDNRWIKTKPQGEITEVPSLYGAFYVSNSSWYQYIHGFDTEVGVKLSGHVLWGGLENWISIKTWLAGGRIHSINNLETGHIFHRYVSDDGIVLSANNRGDMFWRNKFFIAYTMMIFTDADRLVKKVMEIIKVYELNIKNPSEGRRLIKYHWDYVSSVRERNKKLFIRDINWLCEKFGIKQDY